MATSKKKASDADDELLVAFRSPYNQKHLVRVPVPQGFTVSQLREASECSMKAHAVMKERQSFSSYPLTPIGAVGLLVLTRAMPEKDAATDDALVSGMLGAVSFCKQTLAKLEENKVMPRSEFDQAVDFFGSKYGEHFYPFALERMRGLNLQTKRIFAKRIERMVQLLDEGAARFAARTAPAKKTKRERSRSR